MTHDPVPGKDLIGIDVGGTFTDFVWIKEGQIQIQKVPTSVDDQSAAIVDGLRKIATSEAASIVHGSTVATNALLEGSGARTALITTEGFADVLRLGRQNRPFLYALSQKKPLLLVPDEFRFEVEERLDFRGEPIKKLTTEAIQEVVEKLKRARVESVAVVLLYSFMDPTHEERIRKHLKEAMPEVFISLSSVLLPEYREYERTATTVINAYVQPEVSRYLKRVQKSIGEKDISIMQSSGGTIELEMAAEQAARLVLSGPAGGAVGALGVAAKSLGDNPNLLTLDMGGTSTDVAYCPGQLPRTNESTIADLPLRFPTIDIHTVGAGGGSIARIDQGGVLSVGPQSAGARPGPVCYNRGGKEPTVTDANVVLGRIDAEEPLGGPGGLVLDIERARDAVSKLGKKLGFSLEETALGILRVANATMERAMRKVSVEKGHDPRTSTLVPFGGAGPLHACDLAEALGMDQVLVPRYPGVLSAMGMLMADRILDASQSLLMTNEELERDATSLHKEATALKERLMPSAIYGKEPWVHRFSLDMRYRGQSYELTVPLHDRSSNEIDIDAALNRFHQLHEQRFGYSLPEAMVECITLRVQGLLPALPVRFRELEKQGPDPADAHTGTHTVWFGATRHSTPNYSRERLMYGNEIIGPARVQQYDTVLLVHPGWKGSVDKVGNILMRRTE